MTILVFGGSQGARAINETIADTLHELLFDEGAQIFHVAGSKLYEETKNLIDPKLHDHERYKLMPFCHDMAAVMAMSNLAVCRSGSVSLSELFAAGLPSVLVPFPYAAGDHQLKNAEFAVENNAAIMITDTECNKHNLLKQIQPMIQNPVMLNSMKQSALKLSKPNATIDIVNVLKQIV